MQKKDLATISINTLHAVYATVQERQGWDFSMMQTEKEPVPWDYMNIVSQYIQPTDYVLDIGTGGGEKFIKLSQSFRKGVGIDPNPQMIKTAKANLNKENTHNVTFKIMAAEDINYPENTFSLVINRHAVVVPRQVAKVLQSGGYFITQQVHNNNMKNLKQTFGYQKTWQNDVKTLSREFKKNHCQIVANGMYNVQYWVKDLESLMFWLKAVDMPENFTIENHGQQLMRYIKRYATPKGFVTNEAREFLIVQKL